jgi:asparagine synthase (glutamine-hydrolysing)
VCGFAGFLDTSAPAKLEERTAILHRMGAQLARRGPDDQQIFCDDVFALVFRRLSVVDINTGTQPIWNEDGSVMAAVNGEIYNHRELRDGLRQRHTFRSRSDCEIVLHLFEDFGVDAFARLNGIFAVCIWERLTRKLILARDHLGVKPMFYSVRNTHLLFGSELKALRVHPKCSSELEWDDFHRGGPLEFMHSP